MFAVSTTCSFFPSYSKVSPIFLSIVISSLILQKLRLAYQFSQYPYMAYLSNPSVQKTVTAISPVYIFNTLHFYSIYFKYFSDFSFHIAFIFKFILNPPLPQSTHGNWLRTLLPTLLSRMIRKEAHRRAVQSPTFSSPKSYSI